MTLTLCMCLWPCLTVAAECMKSVHQSQWGQNASTKRRLRSGKTEWQKSKGKRLHAALGRSCDALNCCSRSDCEANSRWRVCTEKEEDSCSPKRSNTCWGEPRRRHPLQRFLTLPQTDLHSASKEIVQQQRDIMGLFISERVYNMLWWAESNHHWMSVKEWCLCVY